MPAAGRARPAGKRANTDKPDAGRRAAGSSQGKVIIMKTIRTTGFGRGGRTLAAALVVAVPLLAASCSSAANGSTAGADANGARPQDDKGTQVSASQQKVDQAAVQQLKETGQAFAQVAREVSPAVVFVKVEKTVQAPGPFGTSGQPGGDDLLRHFFEMPFGQQAPEQEHVMAQGSGFIVSSSGEIITNNHVVGDADKISVTLDDGREFPAKVVGTDPHSDVAVIKIDAKDLPSLQLGNSDKVEVGEWVVAVGNPFGLSESITAGIVSAKGRSSVGIADYEDFIQTDAAINPGNSGGPLIDLDGQVVGMNTAIYSRSGGNMGIGFAIPANMVRSIADQLEQTRHRDPRLHGRGGAGADAGAGQDLRLQRQQGRPGGPGGEGHARGRGRPGARRPDHGRRRQARDQHRRVPQQDRHDRAGHRDRAGRGA